MMRLWKWLSTYHAALIWAFFFGWSPRTFSIGISWHSYPSYVLVLDLGWAYLEVNFRWRSKKK